jgi:hypothetical protein
VVPGQAAGALGLVAEWLGVVAFEEGEMETLVERPRGRWAASRWWPRTNIRGRPKARSSLTRLASEKGLLAMRNFGMVTS